MGGWRRTRCSSLLPATLPLLLLLLRGPRGAAAQTLCCCGYAGAGCSTPLSITSLTGLSGSVTGATALGGADWFANAGSPDAYFSVTVPANAVSLDVTTCHNATNFNSFLTLLPGCLRGRDDGAVLTASGDRIQENDDSACDAAGTGSGCAAAST
jgi:hypothetical protein